MAIQVEPLDQGYKSYGEVYTNPDVVDFMLDLTGYTTDKYLVNFGVVKFGAVIKLVKIVWRNVGTNLWLGYSWLLSTGRIVRGWRATREVGRVLPRIARVSL